KKINDTYGHGFGDRVLVTIAETLKAYKPKDSYAYRFGGDEFVVFIPYAYKEKIDRFTNRVDKELTARNILVSQGVIMTDPDSGHTLDDYLVMADRHMYKVKRLRKQGNEERSFGAGGLKRPQPLDAAHFHEKHFYKGVDISNLPEREEAGCRFYDADMKEKDAFELLKDNGVNSVRLRLWHDPSQYPESGGYCDLKHTLEMAERIRDNGLHFMLDFHYSDYWADPGKQRKPEAWADLSGDLLIKAVYDYTHNVLTELSRIDALPDIVQIGNEIRSGMLFPDGAVPDYTTLALLVNAGIRAVRDISEDIKVMIHLDQGGRFYSLKEWFDSMFAAGMLNIDAIGISFYSFWHGTFADLKESMTLLIDRYDLPVYVVETAHPWRHCEHEHVSKDMMSAAGLPAGIEEQKKSLEIVMQIAAEAAGDKDTGVYYWEPLCITGHGFGSWDENMGMLGTGGEALKSFEAFKEFDPAHPPIKDLDTYIESLYRASDEETYPAGTNLVPNGDFKEGLAGWWATYKPENVVIECEGDGLYVSSVSNFTFDLRREIRVTGAGTYRYMLKYRGSNTTGVRISMYLKVISYSGENIYEKPIYPSDVDYVTYSSEDIKLAPGTVQVGIRMDAPPVFGRVTDISLIKV
nr:glycosyl hydrolase 53 family protein [Lachnospiraceae bacterium]